VVRENRFDGDEDQQLVSDVGEGGVERVSEEEVSPIVECRNYDVELSGGTRTRRERST
jgi:hypothetical protein